MRTRWSRPRRQSCRTADGARRWAPRHAHSMRRIKGPPGGSGPGLRRSSRRRRMRRLAAQVAVDPCHVVLGQRPDCLLELELADQEVVVRLGEVESGLEYLLLLIEDVEVGP